jgi:hypothetical protein
MPNAQWERVVCRLLMKSIVDGAHRAGSRDDREDTGTMVWKHMVCVKSPRGRPHLSFMSNLDLEAYINNIIDTIQYRNLLRADRSFECPFQIQRLAYWLTGTVVTILRIESTEVRTARSS